MNNRLYGTTWADTPEEGFTYVSFYSVSKDRKVFVLFQSELEAEAFLKDIRTGGKNALEYRDQLKGKSAFKSSYRWSVYHMNFAPGADFFGRTYDLVHCGSDPFDLPPAQTSLHPKDAS